MTIALLGSGARHDARSSACAILLTSGLFALWTARRFPARLAGQGAQIRREIGWSLLRRRSTACRRGWSHGAGRRAAGRAFTPMRALGRCGGCRRRCCVYLAAARQLVLLDPPADAPAGLVPQMRMRPPRQPAADRLGGDEFSPVEALTGAVVIPLLVFVVPIHVAMLGLVLAIMTLMGVTNHMGWEMFPAAPRSTAGAASWLITASHHQLHHHKYRCNYGLYFRLLGPAVRHRSRPRRVHDRAPAAPGLTRRGARDLNAANARSYCPPLAAWPVGARP